MTKLLAKPAVRLALRAIVAGVLAGAAVYREAGGGTVAWTAVAAAAIMAASEYFTPLNALVGAFKPKP